MAAQRQTGTWTQFASLACLESSVQQLVAVNLARLGSMATNTFLSLEYHLFAAGAVTTRIQSMCHNSTVLVAITFLILQTLVGFIKTKQEKHSATNAIEEIICQELLITCSALLVQKVTMVALYFTQHQVIKTTTVYLVRSGNTRITWVKTRQRATATKDLATGVNEVPF